MSPDGPDTADPPTTPSCITCGYDLTGQRVDGRCPECGDPIWRPELARLVAGGGWPRARAAFTLGLLSIPGLLLFGVGAVVLGGLALYVSSGVERDQERGGISEGARMLSGVGQVLGFFGLVFGLGLTLLWLVF